MAAAMPVLSIVGTVFSAVGAISQAMSARSAAKYNAAVAERNAVIARQQAVANEAAQRPDAMRAFGRIRSGYGASGVSMEGSPLDVLEDSVAEAELDSLNIRYRGELAATGYKEEAALQRSRAKSALTAGVFKAGSALLGGASSYYNAYGSPMGTGSHAQNLGYAPGALPQE